MLFSRTKPPELPSVSAFGVLEMVHLARAYHIVARLKIADLLAERGMTAEELAAATSVHARSLYRVMRTLAAFDVFAEDDAGRFTLRPDGHLLRSDVVGSVRQWTVLAGLEESWAAFGEAMDVVKTGEDGFRLAHGKGLYELAEEPGHEELREAFVAGMSCWTQWQAEVVVKSYSFASFRRVVDVAGGKGRLIAQILRAHADVRGVLFDQPFSVESARAELREAGVLDRCELVGGSVLQSVPAGADGYLLKHVLRDWSDEESVGILRNVREAMAPGATLFLIDGVIDPRSGVDRLQKLIDLEQMFWLTGGLRTQREWDALLEASGFERVTTVATEVVDMSIMVARRKS